MLFLSRKSISKKGSLLFTPKSLILQLFSSFKHLTCSGICLTGLLPVEQNKSTLLLGKRDIRHLNITTYFTI